MTTSNEQLIALFARANGQTAEQYIAWLRQGEEDAEQYFPSFTKEN